MAMDAGEPPQATVLLRAGQEALARGAWEEARSAFERALTIGEGVAGEHPTQGGPTSENGAELYSGLAEALWWLGEIRRAFDWWERAYLGFRRRPDPVEAASVAIQLSLLYEANLGNSAAAAGWVARAARLVEEHTLEPLRGWVLVARAVGAPDPANHETWARRAQELGQASGDRDLELCALTQIGVALIDQGRIAEGTAFHDEAMAGALAGEGELHTVVFASCEMMTSYGGCAQYQRMAQWIKAAERFVERYGCPYLDASCRTHYGGVLFATGEWVRAEEELRAAIRLSENSLPAVQARALAKLAELRLAQGRDEEAGRLVSGFEDHRASGPARTRIYQARGEPDLAAATARRWLDVVGEDQPQSAPLLELLGEAEIARGQAEVAAEIGRKLADLGYTFGCTIMVAHGERLRGHALATIADESAMAHLDTALGQFVELEMPFEAACTRLMIARALRESRPELAGAEARAALAVFDGLGADQNAVATADLILQIGATTRELSTRTTGLSPREVEVLSLVARGMSNQDIADRLVLSKHTVHRHVSSILGKLDLPSRAAAAAYAARHDLLP